MSKFQVGDRVRGNQHFFMGQDFMQYDSNKIRADRIGTVSGNENGLVTVVWDTSGNPPLWHESYLDLVENGLDTMLRESFGE